MYLTRACSGVFESIHGCFWKNFSYYLVTMPESFAPGVRLLGRLGWALVTRQLTVALGRISGPLRSRCSHLENWKYFLSFPWLTLVMTGSFFSPLSAAFFGLLFGVEARCHGVMSVHLDILRSYTSCLRACVQNNNNNTIWGGSVLTGEEPPPHSGKLNHALSQAGGPTQSPLSRPMSSVYHISMEHRLWRKQLNSDTNASNKTY